jgi:hypothetical protein
MPFYGAYKALGHYPDYWSWKIRGQPERAPHLVKERTVREYGARYGLKTLIETGTYYGEMIAAVREHFDRIYSIEYDPQLAGRATRKFSRYAHIRILQGDSQQLLAELLNSVTTAALFWLDAGYYGWAGFQGDKQRLPNELATILRHPIQSHVILLDDARCLNGQNGAPTLAEMKSRVEFDYPGHILEVKHDIVRILKPKP